MKQYGDEELSVIAEIARMYYVEGMSQIDIANMLFFSKAKVSRALRIAREENIVEFHINYPLKRSMKLETELKRKFGLQDARVVVDLYGNESTDISIKRIGEMAAGYLDETLKDGDIVGLSWGKTMYHTIKNITPSEPKKIQVVQVVGNSTDNYNLDIDVTSLVQKMAKIYQGTAHFLYAPMYINSDIVRKELLKESVIRRVIEIIRRSDYVVTGIADVSTERKKNTWAGYLTEEKMQDLVKNGAVGYLCGYFLDKNGKIDAQKSIDLDQTRLLQKLEGYTYKSIGVGAQIRYDFRGGQPFANVGVGINMNEMADLVYETGFNITAPVSMQKDGNFSLGDFSVQKTYSRYLEEENIDKEEPDMTEVYTGYYDLTHNGYKEKVVTKVYLEEENGDLTEALRKAGNWGTVAVYEYLGDGQYGIIPLWSQEFAIAHAGNVQIFLTQKDGYDYLVVTSFWTGQGVCYYDYNVLSPVNYSFDRYHNELKGADHYDPQFFTGLESWLKEDSLLLVATDIDMPQGQEVILTTDEETHYAEEYLMVKKERLQSVEDID